MQSTRNPGSVFVFDTEPERTFHIRKRRKKSKQARRTSPNCKISGNNDNNPPPRKTLREYASPGVGGLSPSIITPAVTANYFELKPSLISMVQQNQFGGLPMEDANLHLSIFIEVCSTLKVQNVNDNTIRLKLFPFSLRDKARAWLHSLPAGSITTWDQLVKAFLVKYFPPSKTASLRNQITTFSQKKDESLYET